MFVSRTSGSESQTKQTRGGMANGGRKLRCMYMSGLEGLQESLRGVGTTLGITLAAS